MQHKYDFSEEMIITRHLNGVKLETPQSSSNDAISLSNLSEMPYNAFFFDEKSTLLEANDACLTHCGFDRDAIGRSIYSVCKTQADAEMVTINNSSAINNNNMVVVDESMVLVNDIYLHTVSFKFPWYGKKDEMLGVFGCAVHVDPTFANNISGQIAMIVESFCKSPSTTRQKLSARKIHGIHLSAREMEVVNLIMRGKTLKEAALHLHLSQRTVESYFSNIKLKLNVQTKSEFFEKMLSEG